MPGYSTAVGGTLPWGTQVFSGVRMAPTVAIPVESTTQILGGFEVAVAPTTTGQPKAYLAGAFASKPLKAWTGSGWVTKPVKVWTGSGWKTLT